MPSHSALSYRYIRLIFPNICKVLPPSASSLQLPLPAIPAVTIRDEA